MNHLRGLGFKPLCQRLISFVLFGTTFTAIFTAFYQIDTSGCIVGWQRGWPQPILALNDRGETAFFLLNYLTNCFYLGLIGVVLPVLKFSFEGSSGIEFLKHLREQFEKKRITSIERFLTSFFSGNFLTAFSVCYSYNFPKLINVSNVSGWGFPFNFLLEGGGSYPVFHFNNFVYCLLFWWFTSWIFSPLSISKIRECE
jgi:hypothetical protein